MQRIIVSVTNDLITDQRVHKICTTLFDLNYDVLLIGRKLKDSKDLIKKYKTYRFNLLFNKGFLFYAEYNFRLFFKLLFLKKDILYSNDLDTLLPNFLISRLVKKALIYDSHELFTEVPELIDRPFTKSIWEIIEKFTVPKLKNCITVSNSIANFYNIKYQSNFSVVRNIPIKMEALETKKFSFDTTNKKIILYQGSLNKGRGLELMINTVQFLDNVIFVIIGTGDIEKIIKQKVIESNLIEKVKFIPRTLPCELKKLTPLADLGISLEEDLGLNYRFALPNKIFDYIQAKVPVLVSNLPEMNQIIKKHKIGEIALSRNPKTLATQINKILLQEKGFYSKQFEIAKEELNWEKESKKLIKIIEKIE